MKHDEYTEEESCSDQGHHKTNLGAGNIKKKQKCHLHLRGVENYFEEKQNLNTRKNRNYRNVLTSCIYLTLKCYHWYSIRYN